MSRFHFGGGGGFPFGGMGGFPGEDESKVLKKALKERQITKDYMNFSELTKMLM